MQALEHIGVQLPNPVNGRMRGSVYVYKDPNKKRIVDAFSEDARICKCWCCFDVLSVVCCGGLGWGGVGHGHGSSRFGSQSGVLDTFWVGVLAYVARLF